MLLIVTLTQSRNIWEGSLNGKLASLGWSVGVYMGDYLGCIEMEEPLTVGGTSPYVEYLALYKHREGQLSAGMHEYIPPLCS